MPSTPKMPDATTATAAALEQQRREYARAEAMQREVERARNRILGRDHVEYAEREPVMRFDRGMSTNLAMPPSVAVPRARDQAEFTAHDVADYVTLFMDYNYTDNCYRCAVRLNSLDRAAAEAISVVASSFVQSLLRDERSRRSDGYGINQIFINTILQGISRARAIESNINQMAKDNVWPLFWHTIITENPNVYERETAKDDINRFKANYNISNKHWKFLCSKSHLYLYHLYKMNHEYHMHKWDSNLICLPDHSLRDTLSRPQIRHTFVRHWLKDLFDGDTIPDANGTHQRQREEASHFRNILRDMCDIFERVPNMNAIEDAFSDVTTWRDFERKVRYIEANPMIRPGGINIARRGEDLVMGNYNDAGIVHAMYYGEAGNIHSGMMNILGIDMAQDTHKPTKEPYECLENYPKEIVQGGFKAELMDNDIRLKKEGDTLRHCIYSTYRRRISNGEYMALHITGDGCGKSGVTCGLKKKSANSVALHYNFMTEEVTQEDNRELDKDFWEHDQTRGKGNSTPDFKKGLKRFIDHVVEEVNNCVDKKCHKK